MYPYISNLESWYISSPISPPSSGCSMSRKMLAFLGLKPTVLWPYKQWSKVRPFELFWTAEAVTSNSGLSARELSSSLHSENPWTKTNLWLRPPVLEARPLACWEDAKASEMSISLPLQGIFCRYPVQTLYVSVHASVHTLWQMWEKCCSRSSNPLYF